MADAYETRVRSLRRLIKLHDSEITKLDARIAEVFGDDEGYRVIQQLNGVGPVIAAVFCAELGDVTSAVRIEPFVTSTVEGAGTELDVDLW